jgi:hypothetical protein
MCKSVWLAAVTVLATTNLPSVSHARDLANYQQSVFADPNTSPLPPGFHDFRPTAHELRVEQGSGRRVLCRDMYAAISFGKRLALGLRVDSAVQDMSAKWGGDSPCWFATGVKLTPVAFAVRGDDTGRRISVVQWVDQHGRSHFTGSPKQDECELEQPQF